MEGEEEGEEGGETEGVVEGLIHKTIITNRFAFAHYGV